MAWLWSFSKWMTCTWNIFGMNSWNRNLIFHQTRGVSWFNVSVSQATCQTWPLSNDDDGCSSLEQSVWWWSCIFFWWRAEFVLDSHVTVPEINKLGTWKIDELTSILSPCLFFRGKSHTKNSQLWSRKVFKTFTNTLWATQKRLPFLFWHQEAPMQCGISLFPNMSPELTVPW